MTTNLPLPIEVGLRSLVPSVVRTLIPVVVGMLVRVGFAESSIDNLWLERALTIIVTMGYYVAVRVLETYWGKIGWLLGFPQQPVYVKGNVISAVQVDTPPTTTTVVQTDDQPDDLI